MFRIKTFKNANPILIKASVVVQVDSFYHFGNFSRLTEGGAPQFMLEAVHRAEHIESIDRIEDVVADQTD